jgi:hypothetical protein
MAGSITDGLNRIIPSFSRRLAIARDERSARGFEENGIAASSAAIEITMTAVVEIL